jgi:PAS domain S-box-containing protein
MHADSPPSSPARSSVPYQVLALSLLLTCIATYYLISTSENRDRLRFQNLCQRAQGLVEDHRDTNLSLLLATSGLFAVDEAIGHGEFQTFVKRLDLRREYPGIQGIGFSRRLAPGEVEPLVRAMRRQGFPEFRIWPEEARGDAHAVLFLEPLDRRNRAALGYDMFTEPARRAAMERARDTGRPAATGKVTLIQEIEADQQPGFLLYIPVYRHGLPLATQQDRRSALLGFVYGAFRASDLLGESLGPPHQPALAVQVFAGRTPAPEGLLYDTRSRAPDHEPRFTQSRQVDIAGTPWTIVFSTLPAFDAGSGRGQAWIVLLLGLTTSAILFLLSRSQVSARVAAERSTADLSRSEEALRQTIERYRQLVELSPEAIFIQRDGRLSFVNSALLRLLGAASPEQILGRPVLDFVHPDSHTRAQESGSLSPRPLTPGRFVEERWITQTGRTVDVEAAAGVFLDGGEGEWGTASQVLLRDITDRKAAERRLREEAEITETLHSIGLATAAELDLRNLAQIIVDATTRITGARFGAFFYHLVDEGGEVCREHALAGDPPEGIADFLAPRNSNDPQDLEIPGAIRGETVVRIDDVLDDSRVGRHPPLERGLGGLPVRSYLTAPVISRSGEVLGGLFFGHSEPGAFTGRVERILTGIAAQSAVAIDNARLYEAERRARAEAETANQAKDRFMASLSHELRTPLTPVLAIISGLERDDRLTRLPREIGDRLAMIRRNVELEARLIDDLLDLTRINRGKLELKAEVADLREILAHATNACCPPDGEERAQFNLELPEGDLRLWADAPRLTQVFWNLLKNAVKFSPEETPVRIRVSRDERAGQLVAEVIDQGIGIEPQRLSQVFDAFEQGQRSITRQYGGLGLGLAISKSIVELHGGRISAHSDGSGHGSTFTVRLPVGAARLESGLESGLENGAPSRTGAAEPSGGASSDGHRPLRILLVEDHPDTAEAMETLLSVVGHQVTVAHSASEALAAAASVQDGTVSFDLVISDVGLPDISGHELMSQLKSRFQLRGIALSGYGMDEDIQRSHEAGFERHLTKPVNLQLLQEVIREVTASAWHAP